MTDEPQNTAGPSHSHSLRLSSLGSSHASQPSQAGPSTSSTSIRSYRSKKIRPCDNCRSRRQRCDIPRAGEACRLCVVTKKQCTFLRERRKAPSDLKKLAEREAELTAQLGKERTPRGQNSSAESAATHASTSSSPEPGSTACLAHLTSYILSTRGAPMLVPEPMALDAEGDADEELYLVGTASERDALILNNMTDSVGPSLVQPRPIPGVRLRTVAPGVHFVFYKSMPYGSPDEGTWATLRDMITPALVPTVLQAFFAVEAPAHPVLRHEPQLSSPILRCMILTAGLMYIPQLRRLHKEAYVRTMAALRSQSPKARLWTLQVYLLDLDGRETLDASGNFVTLGLAISTALLLGLHQDCGAWSIPAWEKELRTRLWWSLLNYDRFSSLTFGRPRHIVTPNVVPLPPRNASDTMSYDAFVSACELGAILDDLDSPHASLASLASMSMRLDAWKNAADSRGLFAAEPAAPGVRSTQLLYFGSCIMVVRAIFDALDPTELDALEAARHSCLMACEGVVDFVAALTPSDLYGYWTSHSPFMLSLTLTMLVRIIVNAGEAGVRETALLALRRFTSFLGDHQNTGWDVGQLALARAHYFIPLLTRRNPEFGSVLDSVQSSMPAPADGALADFLNNLVDPSGMHELGLGGLFSVPTL
ncbi:hypothetical protein CC85DRAFT_118987 [Cutaneotrichosporon oleaginosum]|uniref:Zn(2)-C6 fungal-type domain-containing protein n=1 Tax=Cutaneotrichosporon oleaginosum TaxID=879819 RepID=A0A0J0XKI0_9TREE|nr:uncharacterized protein CC85DRAFT_118987 [Cutaneotrichosporon oleaginosum]KLT41590.1 hypothetical protein CC85DRAFT_118987 [Cutaneotrichosporon oleaginosum]TXT09356.1 hypothetical protein COLE_03290 [Cutaneotrichosporon oleaginosum]